MKKIFLSFVILTAGSTSATSNKSYTKFISDELIEIYPCEMAKLEFKAYDKKLFEPAKLEISASTKLYKNVCRTYEKYPEQKRVSFLTRTFSFIHESYQSPLPYEELTLFNILLRAKMSKEQSDKIAQLCLEKTEKESNKIVPIEASNCNNL